MYTLENVPLSAYSTMRLGGPARYLTDINNRNEIPEALEWATQHQLPVIMIGGGSNIYWDDGGFNGLVLVNKILRFEVFEEDGTNVYVTAGAGENWDSVVKRTVDKGYTGIEQLSLIPGLTGATPIQNVGAYGREIKDVLVTVEAYDTRARQFVTIPGSDCQFAYRSSRFKTTDKGRFFITAITLHLTKGNPAPPYYEAVAAYFKENNIANPTPQTLRDAVIAIRTSKLPDPATVANNGSFFHNPIIPADQFLQLQAHYPMVPHWQVDNNKVKISAAWLMEQAGFKDFHDSGTGMATWKNQPLVFVNEHAQSTADLRKFRDKVAAAVKEKFGIVLQQEPEELP